ncbi:MAG: MotA/TolQ/ExbB proton channel family protein [bacterium]|nr:MotA/TolQ/ExbB proton channel family protein [bacterium]
MSILQLIKLFFIEGGFFMYAILAASIFGLAIIFERFYKVGFQFRIDSESFMNKVFTHLKAGEIDQAIKLCGQSRAPLPIIIKAGLEKHGQSESEIQNAIDETTLEQLPRVSRRIEYLNMIANIATLMGLLGTIQGLIQAFHAVGHVDAAQKATMLAGGIAMALNTTAFGLIVAIPCMISYSILNSMSERILDDIDHFSLKLVNFLKRQ